jgi:hypothetical protein
LGFYGAYSPVEKGIAAQLSGKRSGVARSVSSLHQAVKGKPKMGDWLAGSGSGC